MELTKCLTYLLAIGIFGFVIGRLLPKNWFRYNKFPYATYPFEENGDIYKKLKIKSWQSKLPDMSRIFPKLITPKRFEAKDIHRLPEMIQETCIAEFIHLSLCFAGFYCIILWKTGGILIAILNILGNLPFILIQRFNRPRLVAILMKSEKRRPPCAY
ncbi:MAG: glycosyl-4,4'-diaponeurosporenoate acyltransferase [Lachnospiraceae bacterium]|nr:glycosyl-4,4'-diaponeurosporenoate acyltransferase [Lachnospiraceae bacterium]